MRAAGWVGPGVRLRSMARTCVAAMDRSERNEADPPVPAAPYFGSGARPALRELGCAQPSSQAGVRPSQVATCASASRRCGRC